MHGSAAPQVREAAQRRILALIDPALARLAHLIDTADSDAVRLRAARDILDRAGIGEPNRIEVTSRESDVDRHIRELLDLLAGGRESATPLDVTLPDLAASNGQEKPTPA